MPSRRRPPARPAVGRRLLRKPRLPQSPPVFGPLIRAGSDHRLSGWPPSIRSTARTRVLPAVRRRRWAEVPDGVERARAAPGRGPAVMLRAVHRRPVRNPMTEAPAHASNEQAHVFGQLLRISVVAGDRKVDVAAPRSVPIAELIPGLARTMGLLEAGTAYGGYTLTTADSGSRLDPALSLHSQGVTPGDVLTLTGGANAPTEPSYDDIVEAVADAVESEHRPWTPQDSAMTALLAATALLLTGAVLLFGGGAPAAGAAVMSGSAALLLLVSAVVLSIGARVPAAPVVLVQAAAVFAFVAGYRGLPRAQDASAWGMPLLVGGAAVLGTGLLGLLLIRRNREFAIVPVVCGAGLAIAGFGVEQLGLSPDEAFAIVVAVAVLAGLAIPWLALSTTPLRVISPRDDEEVYADVPPVERPEIAAGYAHGHRVHIGLRVGAGLLTLIAIPAVVGGGAIGTLLMVSAFAGMLLSVRDSYSRVDVTVVVVVAISGLAATGLTSALLHPDWRTTLTIAVGAVAIAVVAFTLVAPRPRLWLGRLADAAEFVSMGALIPLVVVLMRWGA
ncbi:type VII secretion integral membrane protein EccD [Pseudactinotalea sp. HY158]|nr:type VII secretion integral membrane protein EccD [Pseudactinotalea sp. HY158]